MQSTFVISDIYLQDAYIEATNCSVQINICFHIAPLVLKTVQLNISRKSRSVIPTATQLRVRYDPKGRFAYCVTCDILFYSKIRFQMSYTG